MISWPGCPKRGCLRAREAWRLRRRTAWAMVLLCVAQLAVRLVPFGYWRATLGRRGSGDGQVDDGAGAARHLAVHVERAAARLPFATKCLPHAMALCWLLRGAGIPYVLKIAARPAAVRHTDPPTSLSGGEDTLHAWVESGNVTVIGALPGPWLVVLALRG
jgi:hypothetical protein